MSLSSATTPLVMLDSFGGNGFGASWRFTGHVATLEAMTPEEVPSVLGQVERVAAEERYAVGFVAYEAASALNPDLPSLPPQDGLPLAWFAVFTERRVAAAGEGLPDMVHDAAPDLAPQAHVERYAGDVARIREYIARGDTYQVNYTFPITGTFAGDPASLYHRVGRGQRAPFCALIDTGRFTLLSASPELFFALGDGTITTRPMKGTAKRGRWAAEDLERAERLRQDPKERAENLMIVDLLRNDLGIVAETGSVSVDALFEVETYPTVHQMTSTVRARLRGGTGLVDIFRALFPCGSVTGAPKRRSMEIIAELEERPRGVYCGAIGCVAPGGEALFSVAIRTLLLDRQGGNISLGVGSGVTWDSDPAAEYAECLAKGAFLGGGPTGFHLIESLRLEPDSAMPSRLRLPGTPDLGLSGNMDAGGCYPLLERHLRRLAGSAAYFDFPFDEGEARTLLTAEAARHDGLRKVRLLLSGDGGMEVSSEVIAEEAGGRPLQIGYAVEPVDSRDVMRYHKSSRREILDRARAAQPECDELIFLNERGEVAEGSYHTLVARLDGALVTPPLSCGLLPGVMREDLMARGEVTEKVLYPPDLARAEELWLVNAVRGRRRAVLMDKSDRP